eukprot:Cvel_29471.t1-p1 / transcript=Cvel_29471.t1 / gene=Cvel_29471 / organism=Chromera_velia_CCMP2878 / gene_product=hypothetical protein / transcript_product=hypothetical protein / location=Cvel_scaffold4039:8758-10065(+) / protein_length=436 / sequence_SO=supercontig / SO=protein_coding / is_pseudo=false
MGQDKWLGGTLGADGNIYGIPGSAEFVLKIDTSSGCATTIGPRLRGKLKWLRGILTEDGAIIGIPSNANSVLRIDPQTGDVSSFGGGLDGRWKWHGAVLAGDGNIYCIPCNAEQVLKIRPKTREVELIGPFFKGRQKWYGGLLGRDGKVYGIPNNADSVIRIDPQTSLVDMIGKVPLGGWKWHGGAEGPDGALYGVPSHADRVLRIDPLAGSVELLGDPIPEGKYRPGGRYKYGGAVVGSDGCLYCLPSDADRVLRVDTQSKQVTEVGPSFLQAHNKWQNGFLGSDDKIYAIPLNAPGVLCIDCKRGPGTRQKDGPRQSDSEALDGVSLLELPEIPAELTLLASTPSTGEGGDPHETMKGQAVGGLERGGEAFAKSREKWEGGVEGPDGCLYCMPMRAKTVLKICPCRNPHDAVASPATLLLTGEQEKESHRETRQ